MRSQCPQSPGRLQLPPPASLQLATPRAGAAPWRARPRPSGGPAPLPPGAGQPAGRRQCGAAGSAGRAGKLTSRMFRGGPTAGRAPAAWGEPWPRRPAIQIGRCRARSREHGARHNSCGGRGRTGRPRRGLRSPRRFPLLCAAPPRRPSPPGSRARSGPERAAPAAKRSSPPAPSPSPSPAAAAASPRRVRGGGRSPSGSARRERKRGPAPAGRIPAPRGGIVHPVRSALYPEARCERTRPSCGVPLLPASRADRRRRVDGARGAGRHGWPEGETRSGESSGIARGYCALQCATRFLNLDGPQAGKTPAGLPVCVSLSSSRVSTVLKFRSKTDCHTSTNTDQLPI